MSWKDGKHFLGRTNYVEHKVNGCDLKFYPVRVEVMFKLRRIGKPLAKALSTLFSSGDNDHGVTQRTHADGSTEVISEPPATSLAKFRSEQRADSLAEAVDALLDPKNGEVVGELIMDSLQDEFPRGNKGNPSAGGFMGEVSGAVLVDLLKGVAAANKEVLGPLAEIAPGLSLGAASEVGEAPETAGST